MPFDQFNTQVLLLHSDQTTLDKFSASFGDRYTVHCATSGSEALSTLSDTPIHVIVSAQKLHGMSGAEALREAKKRSPDTIGILLAGDDSAIVGDKEVFQVVHGGVDPSDLRRLIDNATQQTRLMALAESANDTVANMDEGTGQHIIMETSENGASIISDATGQVPALDPKKVPPAAAVGAATVDVLVITKDEEFLTTIRESARGMHTIHHSNTLKQAEEAIRKNEVGVAVVDAAMVGNKVEKLTQHLRHFEKRLVSIVAGRRDDGEMLMDLINRGKVYRFLMKPVSPGRARLAIEASVKHHIEAPDSAFKGSSTPPPKKPAPVAKVPPRKSEAKPSAKPKPVTRKPAPQPKAQPAPQPKPKAKSGPAISASRDDALAPADDTLTDAFGDESSLAETVTDLFSTVSKSIGKIKKSKEPPAPDPEEAPRALSMSGGEFPISLSPKIIGAVVAGVAVVALIGFWLFGGSDDVTKPSEQPSTATTNTPESTPDTGGTETRVIEDSGRSADEILEEARLARDAGQIFNPPGNNAIELYMAAVRVAPGNSYVAAELDATLDEALAMAETALLERRSEDAAAALARVALANPDHPRLPFLNAQVAQIQLRDYLDRARVDIHDGRLEDAAMAIERAWALDVTDTTEIDLVEEELRVARSEQRIDEVLALANQKLEEGALTTPANDNARYYFQLALSNDPRNAAAQTGLSVVASKIVLQAREEIDAGRFSTAEALLAEAGQLDPRSEELAATSSALADARQRQDSRQQADVDRAAAERRAEEERQAAARQADQERAAGQERIATLERELRERDAAAAAAAATTTEADESTASADAGVAEPPVEEAAEATPVRDQSPVAASTLTRTRYVAPKYPRAAERRSLSGWVDVVFTVTYDGTVTDIEVTGSEPGDMFVDSATRAVSRWRFEPVVEDGETVEKRAGVRMMFAIE